MRQTAVGLKTYEGSNPTNEHAGIPNLALIDQKGMFRPFLLNFTLRPNLEVQGARTNLLRGVIVY
jgi:hypothetical protein